MSEHTPGPWTAMTTRGRECQIIEQQPGTLGVVIAKADTEANAHLIAAAPDLLAALQGMTDAFGGVPRADYRENNRRCVEAARAAIAKATGCEP